MLGLDAFRRKPRKFEYKPVFFDPQKEEREQRKRELLGVDAAAKSSDDKSNEYIVGSYIREYGFSRKKTQIADRELDQAQRQRNIRRGIILLILLLVALGYLLY